MGSIRRATITIGAFLLLVIAFETPFAQDLKRMRYGVSSATAHLPIWAAKEGGIFSKYGLDVEVILMRAGPLNTLALVSGQMRLISRRDPSSPRAWKGRSESSGVPHRC